MRNNDYLEKYINSLEKNLYPNITYLIKNELIAFTTTNTYIWKSEIFSKNKDNKQNISLDEFYKAKSYTVDKLSNNDKFNFFVNEFINLTLRLFNHLLTYDELKIRLEKYDQFYIEFENNKLDLLKYDKNELNRLINDFDKNSIVFNKSKLIGDDYIKAFNEEYKPLQKLILDDFDKKREKFHQDIKLKEIDSIRSKIEKIEDIKNENFKYGIQSNNIILTSKQKKILFKDYFIRLRGLSKILNISLYNLFLGEPNKKSFLIDLLITLNHFNKDEICINRNFDIQFKNELSYFTNDLSFIDIISPKINQISFNNDTFINSKNLKK